MTSPLLLTFCRRGKIFEKNQRQQKRGRENNNSCGILHNRERGKLLQNNRNLEVIPGTIGWWWLAFFASSLFPIQTPSLWPPRGSTMHRPEGRKGERGIRGKGKRQNRFKNRLRRVERRKW